MSDHTLKPLPLTRERFQPFGDVIEARGTQREAMNAARFERFDDLCNVDVGADGRVSVSVARCWSFDDTLTWGFRHRRGRRAECGAARQSETRRLPVASGRW